MNNQSKSYRFHWRLELSLLKLGMLSMMVSLPIEWLYAAPSPEPWPQMPYVYMEPGPQHADSARMFQGIPTIEVSPGGRLWAAWYGGGECEGPDNYVMLSTSGDNGETWTEPQIIIDPPYRASEPALWVDPQGSLWFMWNLYPVRPSRWMREEYQKLYNDISSYNAFVREYSMIGQQLWVMTTNNPDDEKPTWTEPRLVAMETHNMNKPTVLSDHSWLWPAAPLSPLAYSYPRKTQPLYSVDSGESFYYRGEIPIPVGDRSVEEYQVVERLDGSLWMLTRARYGIGESFSFDQGETWTEVTPSSIAHTDSRFFITRLNSGNLLLVKNGKIDQNVGRSQMMAFISRDDGETWEGGLMLDERRATTYPDGAQSADGVIYVTYDYGRKSDNEILMAVFREEDVIAGKAVSPEARFKVLINKGYGLNPRYAETPPKSLNLDGEPLQLGDSAALQAEGAEVATLVAGATLFSDRNHAAQEVPEVFEGAHFLKLPMDGRQEVTCVREGMVYVLTPHPRRNRDSQSESLFRQGFRKVSYPEVALLGGGVSGYVSIYQKKCFKGETINLGKWAVPVFLSN